jgi:Tol biopolymer transport system component
MRNRAVKGRAWIPLLLIFSLIPLCSSPVQEGEALPLSTEFRNFRRVELMGYTGDAMEPFLSRDGENLFFNSLNDGRDTSLFLARRLNDTAFQLMGRVGGANGRPPHLDAVASMDAANRFYFVSTRDYPAAYENLLVGTFGDGAITGVQPVRGDFYIRKPGWIIMDAEIHPGGEVLLYVNAHFSGGAMPDAASIGAARRANGTFTTDPNNGILFREVNTGGLNYAPSLSADGRELFFTRASGTTTRLLLSKRGSLAEPFGAPQELAIRGEAAEAPCVSPDGGLLYFHMKEAGKYAIFVASRN